MAPAVAYTGNRESPAEELGLAGLGDCLWFGQLFSSLNDNDRSQEDEKAH
jgi:hypothetical protein